MTRSQLLTQLRSALFAESDPDALLLWQDELWRLTEMVSQRRTQLAAGSDENNAGPSAFKVEGTG